MREINYIILHCADTEPDENIDITDIDRWHRDQGWACVGYHYVIPVNGELQVGRKLEVKGAHCRSYNQDSIGICYVGGRRNGMLADTRTPAQRETMRKLVLELLERFPKAKVCGHHDFNSIKACPCFNVVPWAMSIGISPSRIYRYAQ